jgi:DNA-binding SARP family transcriptional activator
LPPLGVPEESGLETASVELLRHFLGCSGIDLAAMEPELVPVLCRALDGLPAALEAAAALFGHLPAHEAARIVREEPLSLSLRGQTLRETFAGTWAALPDEARDFLAANAAWPASFPADLAACLWGRGPATHTTLFLRQIGLLHEAADTPGPRCRVSRLMRFWVRECLPPDPLRQERLARTLLAWVEERKFPRDGSANPEDLRLLGWAWRWLAGRREGEAVGRFARALVEPLRRVREGREEAHELLQSALAYTRTSPPASRARQIRTAAREAPRSSASHLPNILSHPSFPGLLRIRLLGRLEVEGAGDMLTARDLRPKEQRVLARLALGVGRVVPRDTLLELFWPERSFAAAERSLRTVVSSLRAALRPLRADAASGFIRGRMDGYCLEEAACTVDAVSFAAAINDARKAQAEDVPVRAEAAWRRAIALYRGDLLSEFPYEDWCLSERERLRDDLLDALFHVARVAMATSAWHEAREMAARMVAIDPAEERAHRLLMRCHALLGRPAEALRQYERCAAALWEELGAHAGSATVALCEALRAGALLELEEADEPAAHHGMAPGRAGQRVVTPLRSVR